LKGALSRGRWLIRYRNRLLVSQRAEGFVAQPVEELDALAAVAAAEDAAAVEAEVDANDAAAARTVEGDRSCS
jgi:hypothetical protein